MELNRIASLDGLPPAVEGKTCQEFELCGDVRGGVARQWIRIRVKYQCHSLWFLGHTIVWRAGSEPEELAHDAPATQWLKDIAVEFFLRGRKISGLACRSGDEGCEVEFRFDGIPPAPADDASLFEKTMYLEYYSNRPAKLCSRVIIRFDGEEISWAGD